LDLSFLLDCQSIVVVIVSYININLNLILSSFSCIASQNSLLGIPKKQTNALRVSFCSNVELCGPRFCNKLNPRHKLPRDVIVRSEITAGDGYSIPGLY
jgi:hypothetical protein